MDPEATLPSQDLSQESETQVRASILTRLRRKETRKHLQEWVKQENRTDIFMRRSPNISLLVKEVLVKRTEDKKIKPTTKFMLNLYLFLSFIPAEILKAIISRNLVPCSR